MAFLQTIGILLIAFSPSRVLAVLPLTALIVLFDLVVHNPRGPDTPSNLTLLDMGVGYFSRIDHTSGNTLPGSLVSEFGHIARDYVNDSQRRQHPPTANQGESLSFMSGHSFSSAGIVQNPAPNNGSLDMPMVLPLTSWGEVIFLFFFKPPCQQRQT